MPPAALTVVRGSLGRGGRALTGLDSAASATTNSRSRRAGIGALLAAAACLVPLVGVGAVSASALIREGIAGAVGLGVIGIAVASGRWRGRNNSTVHANEENEAVYG
jgi:hypothetical protein